MRLADDEITITLGTRCFVLRPSLRAAFRLDRKYEGFQKLSQAVADGNFSACADLIETACADPKSWIVYIATARTAPISEVLSARDQLLEFVRILSGADHGEPEGKASTAKPIPFEEYHTRLFRIATGWLGWVPDQAYNATPAEILEAHKGRLEMLAAIFGSKKADDISREEVTPELRARLNALGDTSILTMSQVP